MLLPPPPPTPFPYTTLFRSGIQQQPAHQHLGLARPLGARGALQIVLQHAPGLLGPPGPGQRHPPKEARILDDAIRRSEEHTSELQSLRHLVCRLLLETKKTK